MTLPDADRLQSLITWQFETTEQNQTSRWGTYADAYWKQYLPAGMAQPTLHPPRKVLQAVYTMAAKRAQPLKAA